MRKGNLLFPGVVVSLVALALLIFAPGANAETIPIEIQFTGLNLVFDSPNLFDATSDAGRSAPNDPAEADQLSLVQFEKNGTPVGMDTEKVYADILIKGLGAKIPEGGGTVTSQNGDTFGFDLFSEKLGGGIEWKLELDLTELEIFYLAPKLAIAGTGKASGVAGQDLPFGLPPILTTEDIKIGFVSTNLKNVQTSGGYLTSFQASGTGTISATVPEPSTLVSVLMGALGLLAYAWRRRRR